MEVDVEERPWTKLYSEGYPAEITPDYPTMLHMFRASLARAPDTIAIKYFDGASREFKTG